MGYATAIFEDFLSRHYEEINLANQEIIGITNAFDGRLTAIGKQLTTTLANQTTVKQQMTTAEELWEENLKALEDAFKVLITDRLSASEVTNLMEKNQQCETRFE